MSGALLPRVRHAPGAVVAMLAFGGLGTLAIFAAAPVPLEPVRAAELAAVQLSDDDGDGALFAADQMTPGHPVTNCLRVTYGAAADGVRVRLLAKNASGSLAAALNVRVDMGTGGQFGDCTGFAGTPIYDGTLAGLGAGSAAEPGADTGWAPLPGEERTFRLTATVPDDGTVQGATASATLTWVVLTGSAVEPTKPPTDSAPTPEQSAPAPEPAATVPPTPDAATADPTTAPMRGGDVPAGGSVGTAGQSQPDRASRPGGLRGAVAAVGRILGRTGEIGLDIGVRTARHGGFPLASLAAMTIFLLAQDRIDRRDPKLALAPVSREPYLRFDDPDVRPGDRSGGHSPDEEGRAR